MIFDYFRLFFFLMKDVDGLVSDLLKSYSTVDSAGFTFLSHRLFPLFYFNFKFSLINFAFLSDRVFPLFNFNFIYF